ncbi:MAG: copper chaperone PCu(A)C [Pseudobdellovibrionaceae bacterium]|nr:copper chaperone PCu(A)C [Pseudobdellovibrionaceae bacterium]
MLKRKVLMTGLVLGCLWSGAAQADVDVKGPYSFATSGKAMIGAAFMTIANTGETEEKIISASAPEVCDHVEIHSMSENDAGVMQMRKLQGGLAIPPSGEVELKPMGFHFMLIGLKAPLTEGQVIDMTLERESGDPVKISVPVRPRVMTKVE